MAETFEELGIRPELVEGADAEGYTEPTALQSAAVPVLRRGGNAVLNASAGSGVVAAYGLALLDHLMEEEEAATDPARPYALVLVPTTEEAARTATSLARFARTVDRRLMALAPGWAAPERPADVVVAAPDVALRNVKAARLKLDALRTVVLQDAAVLFELGHGDRIETLTTSFPGEAQRVLTGGAVPKPVEDYVNRHVRRALRIPRSAKDEKKKTSQASVGYVTVPGDDKLDTAAKLIQARGEARAPMLYCRTPKAAAGVREDLALRGFRAGDGEDEEDVDVAVVAGGSDAPSADGRYAISYDVPFDADDLSARHADGGAVLVEPRELPHLRRIAGEAAVEPKPETEPQVEPAQADLVGYRERLRKALKTEDLAAQLLVLEPLLDEASAVELAAAMSALLRRKAPAPQPEGAPAEKPEPETGPKGFVRLFMSIGERDGARPGDLVGAITGEAGVPGSKIGRIEIRDTFSIVEVDAGIGKKVIRAMNGTTVKGRSLRVDYDRKGTRGPRRRGR